MPHLVLEVANDGSRLTIAAADRTSSPIVFDAVDLDAFMRRLAECRATMVPIHPAQPPSDPDRVYRNDNLLFDVTACASVPAVDVAMQHPGLGWTITRLSREQAEDLQTAIDFALQDILKPATAA
jgi:hypothetical protein